MTPELGALARVGVAVLALSAISAVSTCVHKVAPAPAPIVVPIVVLPIVEWTIPLGMAEDARLCVQTELGGWIDPADVRPLRCVSVGAVRAWIRAQRWAE